MAAAFLSYWCGGTALHIYIKKKLDVPSSLCCRFTQALPLLF
jgi:hypothetical protein